MNLIPLILEYYTYDYLTLHYSYFLNDLDEIESLYYSHFFVSNQMDYYCHIQDEPLHFYAPDVYICPNILVDIPVLEVANCHDDSDGDVHNKDNEDVDMVGMAIPMSKSKGYTIYNNPNMDPNNMGK